MGFDADGSAGREGGDSPLKVSARLSEGDAPRTLRRTLHHFPLLGIEENHPLTIF
jgi:hypothetical protein